MGIEVRYHRGPLLDTETILIGGERDGEVGLSVADKLGFNFRVAHRIKAEEELFGDDPEGPGFSKPYYDTYVYIGYGVAVEESLFRRSGNKNYWIAFADGRRGVATI